MSGKDGYRKLQEIEELVRDPKFCGAIETAEDLPSAIRDWEPRRDETLDTLREIQVLIEQSYHKRTIAKVSGASAAIAGSAVAIVGFGLSFFTFGTSLALSVAGAGLAASGAVTMGGADLGDWLVSSSHMKTAERVIERDRERSQKIRRSAEKLSQTCKQLSRCGQYPTLSEENILKVLADRMSQGVKGAKVLYDGYKLVDSAMDVGRAALRVGRFATGASSGARIAWAGLNTVAGGLSVAGVVFDAVALPFDLAVLIKGSIDVHKYRTGRGSNSRRANQVAVVIQKLESHKEDILSFKALFEAETKR